MKKIFLAAALLAASVAAGAQNMYDAINFSDNNYIGSAKSMALGGAVTALGGDLGTIAINPAGSAVAGYSQFSFTPGLSISSVSSNFSPEGENAYSYSSDMTRTRMTLPNIGMTVNYSTGRRYGVRSWTFGLLSSRTADYNFAADGFGFNGRTSKIAEFADAAWGYSEDILKEYNSFNNSDIPWDILAAYQGGMYGPYGWDGLYAGVTEAISPNGDYHYVPGDLAQTSYRTKRGSKNDLILNFAMDISDRVYVGFNLGLPTARYRYSESFYEAAVDPSQFLISYDDGYDTCFKSGSYNYDYLADMAGIYAKVGVIFRPMDGVRLGASFQTPTAYTISETWQYATSTTFDDDYYDDRVTSPQGEYSYTLRSPYRASFGAAFTFSRKGFVSVDYELADYSVMRFRAIHDDRMAEDTFLAQNWTNKYFAGISHAVRLGGELKLNPEWALRGGYSVTTSPERWWTGVDGMKVTADDYEADFYSYFNHVKSLVTPHYYGDRTRSFSAGLGYSSPGSFFMDAAVRLTRYPAMTFAPYYDYASCDSFGNQAFVEAPRILSQRDLWNASLTLGWRF